MADLALLTNIIEHYGYYAIFLAMVLEGACTPVPSELVMGFAGFLVYKGQFSLGPTILTGWAGSLTGAVLAYLLSRYAGRDLLYKWGPRVHITTGQLDYFASWFVNYGPALIIPWRQLPIVRCKSSIAAGLSNMRLLTFISNTAIGIFLWCSLAVYLGRLLGPSWHTLVEIFSQLGELILIGAGFTVLGLAVYFSRHRRKSPTAFKRS